MIKTLVVVFLYTLFLCIAIGLVMAVSTGSFFEHIVLAGFVLLMTYLLEKGFVAKRRSKMTVMFEKPELVHPDRKKELIDELLEFVDGVLDELGSRHEIEKVHDIFKTGTGADRQLNVFKNTGSLIEVVKNIEDSFLA